MGINSDMAAEVFGEASRAGELRGAVSRERFDEPSRMKITEVEIMTDEAAERIGKPRGIYVTLETDAPLWEYSPLTEERVRALSRELERVCGGITGAVMFVGLGNRRLTADSVGVLAAERVLATRHLKRLAKELDTSELAETTVIAAGVMAQTGLETAELTAAVCGAASPSQVIVCDALACFEPRHMGRSIQLCSSGISPGSGVENSRSELSEGTLGVPVAAVGVPTVSRLLGEKGLIVTPKNADLLAERAAELIASAVNRLLYPALSAEEIASLTV